MSKGLVLIISCLIGAFRPFIMNFPHDQVPSLPGSYQAFAHLWLGYLIGYRYGTSDHFYGWVALILSLVELACFLIGKFLQG